MSTAGPEPGEKLRSPKRQTAPPLSRRASAASRPLDPPQRISPPYEKYSTLRLLLGLTLTIAVCLPALLISLDAADVTPGREAELLQRSQETWQRHHAGEPAALLLPTSNANYTLSEPPMTVWLHTLAWTGLEPAEAGAEQLAYRARLLAVGMAIVAVLATYWAGLSVGGASVAWLAALAMGSSVLFIYQGRQATGDSILLGFTTVAMASALWAMRPLKPTAWVGRRVVGWLIAGVALGAGILTAGVLAVVFVLPPLVAAIILTPRRRIGNAFGLLFAVLLGVIAAVPWYLYVLDSHRVPDAWDRMVAHFSLPEHLFVLTWSHGRAFATFFPWIVLLAGALAQPFLRADSLRRRQLLIAWAWFILLFFALSLAAAEHPRYLVPTLPAVALMVGQLWAFHENLAAKGRHEPGIDWLRVPHWLLLLGASIGGAWFVMAQPQLVEAGRLAGVELAALPLWVVVSWATGLTVIALVGVFMHYRWKPRLAAYATVAWMLLAATVGFHAHAHAPQRQYAHTDDASLVQQITADQRLLQLRTNGFDAPLDQAFLFYMGGNAPAVAASQLEQLAAQDGVVYVAAPRNGEADATLREQGFVRAGLFHDGARPRALYRSDAGGAERSEGGAGSP